MQQAQKPMLIEAFVPKFAVETLNVGILRRTTGLVDQGLNAVRRRPGHEGPAGKFRPLIRVNRLGIAPKQRRLLDRTSMTKLVLQTSFRCRLARSGYRSSVTRFLLRRLRTDRFICLCRRYRRLWFTCQSALGLPEKSYDFLF